MLNKIPEVACPFSKSVDVESQTCRCEHRSSRIHLVFIKTEERDGKRNPETSSRRQDNPSQNLSQNVERHRVFMATCIPEVLALVLISSFVGATTPENGTAEPGSLPLQGASAQLVGTNNQQQQQQANA